MWCCCPSWFCFNVLHHILSMWSFNFYWIFSASAFYKFLSSLSYSLLDSCYLLLWIPVLLMVNIIRPIIPRGIKRMKNQRRWSFQEFSSCHTSLLIYWFVVFQNKDKEKKKSHSHRRHKLKAKEVENGFFCSLDLHCIDSLLWTTFFSLGCH